MYALGRTSACLLLSMVCFYACKAGTQTTAQLTTINGAQGGRIVYGGVAGATTQGAALSRLLSMVHTSCGEKPQIGRVFQFTGTTSVGVFFTVTDHPEGNQLLAGMVIATATGPNQVEGAMLYDYAARFSTTVNPLLQQLSGVWHPGAAPAAGAPSAANAAPAAGSPAGMHTVMLPDSTARVNIPSGWAVDPKSGGGTMLIHGPHGEVVILDNMFNVLEPNSPLARSYQQSGIKQHGGFIYPSNIDLVKSLPDIIQQFGRANGYSPTELKIDHAEQVFPPPGASFEGERCVQATGQVNPDGRGIQAMIRLVCQNPTQNGTYSFLDSVAYFPNPDANQANAIASAIFSSFQVNIALVVQRATAQAAPEIAHLKQVDAAQRQAVQANTARIVGNINQIGANATARMNATEAANSAEQSNWEAGQNANARNTQGFSNYLLDQSVVQNNYTGAHGTQWNSAADAMVKANPNKYSYVNTPNYVPGTDF